MTEGNAASGGSRSGRSGGPRRIAPDLPAAEAVVRRLLTSDRRSFRSAAVLRWTEAIPRRLRTAPAALLAECHALLPFTTARIDAPFRARLFRFEGHALRALNRYAAAVSSYRRAISIQERLGDAGEAATSRIGLVDALMYVGRYDAALAQAAEARAWFLQAKDTLRVARVETNIANIEHRRDRHVEALASYDRALRAFRRLKDDSAVALVQYNRGNVLGMLGRCTDARAAFEEARAIYAAQKLPARLAQVDYGLAYLPYLENRLPEALEALAAVRVRLVAQGDARHGALCRLDEAEILLRLNLWDDAALAGGEALGGFEALGMDYEAAKARAFLGAASYRRGDLEMARRELNLARRRFLAEPNDLWGGETELGLARLAIDRGQWGQAADWAHKARVRLAGTPSADGVGRAWLLQAAASRGAGRTRQAAVHVARALDEARSGRSPWLGAEADELAGLLAVGRGERAVARDHFEASIRQAENLRALLTGDDFRAAFYRDRDGAYVALARLELEEGRPREAFRVLERGRARALLDLLAGAGRPARGRETAVVARLRKRAQELLRRLGEHYLQEAVVTDRLRHFESAGVPSPDARWQADEVELSRLMEQLARHEGIAPILPDVDERRIRSLLGPDEVMLVWYEMGGRIGCFRLDRDTLMNCPDLASAAEVAALADRLRFQWGRFRLDPGLLARHADQLSRLARVDLKKLHDEIFAPVDPGPIRRRLILVPTASMRAIPFGALHDGRRYLVERCSVTVVPSAGVFEACRRSTPEAGSGPGFDRVLLMARADERAPEIDAELADLAERYPDSRQFRGDGATTTAFREEAPEARLIHLASHGIFRSDRPNLSGLRLADRWLYGYDILGLRLRAELVTLSACRTGQSAAWGSGEWLGLARTFLAAGARRVLAGLWDLDDAATRRLMSAFYSRLGRNCSDISDALASAQSGLAAEGLHPYYWSGLSLVGDL